MKKKISYSLRSIKGELFTYLKFFLLNEGRENHWINVFSVRNLNRLHSTVKKTVTCVTSLGLVALPGDLFEYPTNLRTFELAHHHRLALITNLYRIVSFFGTKRPCPRHLYMNCLHTINTITVCRKWQNTAKLSVYALRNANEKK